jgi:NAD(P)-dependent dehydrogenase (short-subunit alcohol dehydrogenase family)
MRLSGTRVVVTGATSGLGKAMAQALAVSGARVAATSRERSRAQATAVALGDDVVGLGMDVRDEASIHAGIEQICELWGGIDLLVNNAGIGMRTVNPRFMTEPQPAWEVAPAGFADVFATKVTGCFLLAREVVPRMLAAGGGRIVTISMNEQTMTRRGFVPYGPAGAAVEALARILAADLAGTTVSANILLPGGATATGMLPDEVSQQTRASLLDPAIMGPPIVWLASQEAQGVHDERIVAADFDNWLAAR